MCTHGHIHTAKPTRLSAKMSEIGSPQLLETRPFIACIQTKPSPKRIMGHRLPQVENVQYQIKHAFTD